MQKIKCPHCNKQIEISEAIGHELREKLLAETSEQHQKDLEEARLKASRDATEQLNLTVKTLQDEIKENKERNIKLQEDQMELMKQLRKAQQEREDAKIEAEKKLAAEEDKIRLDSHKKAEEQFHLRDREKDLKIEGLMKALDEAQRKAQQGSQQTQGEALELELEKQLRTEFPNDNINEVKKGQKGGDLTQEVWDRNGVMCGTILWEFKNTQNWTDTWIEKLKQDQRNIHAETAVLITEVLPKDIKTSAYRNGVWVTTRQFAIVLAMGLRASLIQVSQVKKSAEGKDEKKEVLFNYFNSVEFNQRMEALNEAFNYMQAGIENERRYFAKKWAQDEKNIRMLVDNTQGFKGELDSILKNNLSTGAVLELIDGETPLES